ncbi:MAG TPA: hypothetical protein VMB73_33020, partial [Acetobacteraceae bacterium]|nr:hypothetical protein [Acetobacteraceae bacterium]
TPANPFGGQAFDIFDVLEQAEANAAAVRQGPAEPMVQQFEPAPAEHAPAIGALETPAAPERIAGEPVVLTGAEAPMAGTGIEGAGMEGTGPAEADVPSSEPRVPVNASPQMEVAATAEAVPTEAGPAEAPMPEIVNTGAPEPVLSEPAAPPAPETIAQSEPPTSPPEVANDVVPEPAIRPILIGTEEAPAEKKRGWWRR